MKSQIFYSLCGLFLAYSTFILAETTEAYLTDPAHDNQYLHIDATSITYTPEKKLATRFTLRNITKEMSQKYGLGNTHYLITYQNLFLNSRTNDGLYLGSYTPKDSHWSSVIHYRYWHILKNNNYKIEQILNNKEK